MTLDLNNIEIVENEQKRRFEAHVGEFTAVMTRYYSNEDLVVTHTIVPEELSGQGLASHMARTVLDQARQQGRSVVPRPAGYLLSIPFLE